MSAFVKMHGLGNDFVLLDARNDPQSAGIEGCHARRIADRRRGVGCDQLLLLLSPQRGGDVRMRVFNPDGSQARACGNGTRCVARYVLENASQEENKGGNKGGNKGENKDRVLIEVDEDCLSATRLAERMFRVAMPIPRFDWPSIPLSRACDTGALPLAGEWDNEGWRPLSAVNIGNPHVLLFSGVRGGDLDFLQRARDRWGEHLEHDALFPERANVSFVAIESPRCVRLSTWERGAGATLACGSAACAVLAAGVRYEGLDRNIVVVQRGGELHLTWREDSAPVLMIGSADYAFRGVMNWDDKS